MSRSPDAARSFERRFSCVAGCTACCRRPGIVELCEDDIERLSEALALPRDQFERAFVRRDSVTRLRFEEDGRCPFLMGNETYGWCGVQESKPTQCSTYPFWPGIADSPARWKKEANSCPGIGHGPRISDRLVQIEMHRAFKVGCKV